MTRALLGSLPKADTLVGCSAPFFPRLANKAAIVMAGIFPERTTPSPTPQGIWQLNTRLVSLLYEVQRLCHDLAQQCLDEETARFRINSLSCRLLRVRQCNELYFWFGQASATKLPQEEPKNLQLASWHLFYGGLIFFEFLRPVLALQIDNTQPVEPSTIMVPQVLTGPIDLVAIAEIAKRFERCLDALDSEDVDLLRAEAELASELLTRWLKDQRQPAPDNGTPIFLGEGRYQIGRTTICLNGSQADALQALIELRGANFDQLRKHGGVSNPSSLLKSICENQAHLAPYISLPGGKNKGGYSTTILDGRKINKPTTTD